MSVELKGYPVQMHSILRRLFGYAKHKARTVASSGLGRVAFGLPGTPSSPTDAHQ